MSLNRLKYHRLNAYAWKYHALSFILRGFGKLGSALGITFVWTSSIILLFLCAMLPTAAYIFIALMALESMGTVIGIAVYLLASILFIACTAGFAILVCNLFDWVCDNDVFGFILRAGEPLIVKAASYQRNADSAAYLLQHATEKNVDHLDCSAILNCKASEVKVLLLNNLLPISITALSLPKLPVFSTPKDPEEIDLAKDILAAVPAQIKTLYIPEFNAYLFKDVVARASALHIINAIPTEVLPMEVSQFVSHYHSAGLPDTFEPLNVDHSPHFFKVINDHALPPEDPKLYQPDELAANPTGVWVSNAL